MSEGVELCLHCSGLCLSGLWPMDISGIPPSDSLGMVCMTSILIDIYTHEGGSILGQYSVLYTLLLVTIFIMILDLSPDWA